MNARQVLAKIGGQAVIARECGISDSAVSIWVAEDHIPHSRLLYLKLAHPGIHWEKYEMAHPKTGSKWKTPTAPKGVKMAQNDYRETIIRAA